MSAFLRTLPLVVPAAFALFSCSRQHPLPPLTAADSVQIMQDNILHRSEVERYFALHPESPFRIDTTAPFHGLRWFPIDPRFRGVSVLHRYDPAETVTVMGTKGEARKQLRYGWFAFPVPDENNTPVTIRLNAYTPADVHPEGGGNLLSVWFTDRTTGKETYHVGRYVNPDAVDPDPGHLYTIDLNKAYNPYCAYSDAYSCAVPREEDHIDLLLRVGEKTYDNNHAH